MEEKLTRTKCRDIMASVPNGVDVPLQDFEYMMRVLILHPQAGEIIGLGIKRIWVEASKIHVRRFWFERYDGSKGDFLFTKCFLRTGEPKKGVRPQAPIYSKLQT